MGVNTYDLPERRRSNYKIQVYRDRVEDFRWRMTDKRNGERVGAATEGYRKLSNCLDNLYIGTGWLPDDVDTLQTAIWADEAPGVVLEPPPADDGDTQP